MRTRRYELTVSNGRSRSVAAQQAARGPRADDRKVLNGIYWRLRTGSPWADIYDSDAMRRSLADRGAWANVKPLPRRVNVPAFSRFHNRSGAPSASSSTPRRRHPLREARRLYQPVGGLPVKTAN